MRFGGPAASGAPLSWHAREAYQPGTTLDLLVKDLRSVQSCAADTGLSLPVAAGVLERILGAWPPK
jgi:3-hydroxyisobutyrate dehydrogenase-like beta-hydroxyacid dehydrogenase